MKQSQAKRKVEEAGGKWEDFCKWMCGQTMGVYEDGSINIYDHDVEAYIKKLKTSYDRQGDYRVWD